MRFTAGFAGTALAISLALGVHQVSAKVPDVVAPVLRGAVRVVIPTWPAPPTRERDVLRDTPAPVAEAIQRSAERYGVPVALVEAVAWQESRYAQNVVSARGARGVMQLTPDTAHALGVNAHDLEDNIDGGCAYLAKLLARYGDTRLALAAYNAGPNIVDKYAGVPPYAETQAYVAAIMARMEKGPAEA